MKPRCHALQTTIALLLAVLGGCSDDPSSAGFFRQAGRAEGEDDLATPTLPVPISSASSLGGAAGAGQPSAGTGGGSATQDAGTASEEPACSDPGGDDPCVVVSDALTSEQDVTGQLLSDGEGHTGTFTDAGWASIGGRISYDLGAVVCAGSIEVTVHQFVVPLETVGNNDQGKIHLISGWERTIDGQLDEHDYDLAEWVGKRSSFSWRSGEEYGSTDDPNDNARFPFKLIHYWYGTMKEGTNDVCAASSARVGEKGKVNDGQPHVYRVTWRAGTTQFAFDGEVLHQTDHGSSLRYLTIGRDDSWENTHAPTARFRDVKIVTYGASDISKCK
jgi:hypothetical protein